MKNQSLCNRLSELDMQNGYSRQHSDYSSEGNESRVLVTPKSSAASPKCASTDEQIESKECRIENNDEEETQVVTQKSTNKLQSDFTAKTPGRNSSRISGIRDSPLNKSFNVSKRKSPSQSKAAQKPSKTYKCPECSFVSSYHTSWVKHKRKHTEQLFHCGTCGCVFYQRSDLHKHVSVAHGKHLACSYCGAAFNSVTGLYVHRKRYHTGKDKVDNSHISMMDTESTSL